ncbi:MAG TPA: CoA transferase [Povalibacter sp.]|uniref:CoA transferase n=1 Tax=Povalibacter sp. TaxID=1962978 RepID=UPI002CD90FFE|nr:CoA transferase [Povalibacter sp.]HMN47049.1 CoA transferase [Povalibacter sp.]
MNDPQIPLAVCADRLLARLAGATGSQAIAALDGQTLLGERALLAGSRIPARISAGGGCRLFDALDDTLALNLARPDDRESLPALFESDTLDVGDDEAIAAAIAARHAGTLVARSRLLGLAIAAEHEAFPAGIAPCIELARGAAAQPPPRAPRVVDLSALWAGPLASHLLWLAGAEVIKVESRRRPDAMREGDGEFYALLNQGKQSVALDFKDTTDLHALRSLIASADIVIEASRPRALAQLGIDASAFVRDTPGLVWITITGHGANGAAADWVGFGDDCGVAAGLSAALHAASGRTGFVGDAIADPLTGVFAAVEAWQAWSSGCGARLGIAMSHVVAHALTQARAEDADGFARQLRDWSAAAGQPFPEVRKRSIGPLPAFGEHTRSFLARVARC